jgi:acetolactate synthase-1/2/3 large subunit
MALGAALATGKPQAFCLVPGPGFLNGCAALCTAQALNAPLFALIGQIPSRAMGKGFGLLHEISGQRDIMAQLTKSATSVMQGSDAPAAFSDAWATMLSGRPGPVGVEVPADVWSQDSGVSSVSATTGTAAPAISADEIDAAAALIKAAQRPLIVVGSGAQDHSDAVRALAAQTGAGVMAFRTGHGVVDSASPEFVSMPQGHRLWPECDLVIGLGTRLAVQKLEWGVDEALDILHIDIDPAVPDRGPKPSLKLTGDLGDALPRISAAIGNAGDDRSAWRARIAAVKHEVSADIAQKLAPQLDWLAAIRSALPADGLFVDELTQIGYVSRFSFPVSGPRRFLSTGYQGTLGWGIATAIGAAHARPDVPVVSISGDGGAMFAIAELATAAHHKIPVTIIVMNDNAFGNVRGIQRDNFDGRFIASDLTSPDFVALAKACGVSAVRATSPDELQAALVQAVAHNGPNLIEVPVGDFPSPWEYIRMPKQRGAA